MLSSLLKEHTTLLHQETEKHPWVKLLLSGRLPMPCYIQYLKFFLPVYSYLEYLMVNKNWLDDFVPEIVRASSLQNDITELIDSDVPFYLDSNNAYLAHLLHQGGENLNFFIAHFYVRYFGDLSGGRLFRDILHKKYGLKLTQLNYYDFSDFLQKYPGGIQILRERLDSIPLSSSDKFSIIQEAQIAFRLTQKMMSNALHQALHH